MAALLRRVRAQRVQTSLLELAVARAAPPRRPVRCFREDGLVARPEATSRTVRFRPGIWDATALPWTAVPVTRCRRRRVRACAMPMARLVREMMALVSRSPESERRRVPERPIPGRPLVSWAPTRPGTRGLSLLLARLRVPRQRWTSGLPALRVALTRRDSIVSSERAGSTAMCVVASLRLTRVMSWPPPLRAAIRRATCLLEQWQAEGASAPAVAMRGALASGAILLGLSSLSASPRWSCAWVLPPAC
jgi:hypothetical protein